MGKINSYIKETVARLTGDKDEVVAQKNYRKATSAVKGQLASLEAKLVNAEDELETAKENLKAAKYPSVAINGGEGYIQNILDAQENVDYAQGSVDDINASIKFNKELLAEFENEVDA